MFRVLNARPSVRRAIGRFVHTPLLRPVTALPKRYQSNTAAAAAPASAAAQPTLKDFVAQAAASGPSQGSNKVTLKPGYEWSVEKGNAHTPMRL